MKRMADLSSAEQDQRLAVGITAFFAFLVAAVWPWSLWNLAGAALALLVWDLWRWYEAVKKP